MALREVDAALRTECSHQVFHRFDDRSGWKFPDEIGHRFAVSAAARLEPGGDRFDALRSGASEQTHIRVPQLCLLDRLAHLRRRIHAEQRLLVARSRDEVAFQPPSYLA
jgi:hypothetical protein